MLVGFLNHLTSSDCQQNVSGTSAGNVELPKRRGCFSDQRLSAETLWRPPQGTSAETMNRTKSFAEAVSAQAFKGRSKLSLPGLGARGPTRRCSPSTGTWLKCHWHVGGCTFSPSEVFVQLGDYWLQAYGVVTLVMAQILHTSLRMMHRIMLAECAARSFRLPKLQNLITHQALP